MITYTFGNNSKAKLQTCHPNLQAVAKLALRRSPIDIAITHGLRDKTVQNALFADGKSKVQYPNSKHNSTRDPFLAGTPSTELFSDALDFAAYVPGVGIPWNDSHAFAIIAGCFFSAASELDFRLRWGGDWDMDGLTTDQTFMDWGHIELVWE